MCLLIDRNGSTEAIIFNHIMSVSGIYFDGNADTFFKREKYNLLVYVKQLFLYVSIVIFIVIK